MYIGHFLTASFFDRILFSRLRCEKPSGLMLWDTLPTPNKAPVSDSEDDDIPLNDLAFDNLPLATLVKKAKR